MDNLSLSLSSLALSPTRPSSTPATTKPFRFLDLPVELRLLVYEELLSVGKVFYTPDWFEKKESRRFKDWEKYAKPEVAVLRVCKKILEEAEGVYLGSNMFVLPHLWYYRDPFYDYTDDLSRNAGRWLFSHRAVTLLKHVSVSLCTRTEIPLTMTYSDWTKHEESDPGAFARLTTVERMTLAHDEALGWLWGERDYIWNYLSQLKGMVTLEIDMTNAYCPVGCCRVLDLDPETLSLAEPKCVRMLGVRDNAEEHELLAAISVETALEAEGLIEKYGIVVNPVADKWEAWKLEDESEKVVEKKMEE